jgi:mycothiol synthase
VVELTWRSGPDGSAAEVLRLAAAAAAVDGVEPLSEQASLRLREGTAEHLQARDGAGALVGYAQLDPVDGSAELVVDPSHRRAGVGSALLGALLERVPGVAAWAHGDLPAAAALARRFDLSVERELWRMRRSLGEPLPDAHPPGGVVLRPFAVGADEAEFLRVNNAAFARHPEQGRWDLRQVALREAEPWFDPAGFLLAVEAADPARVLGFHWTKVHPAGTGGAPVDEPIGEVYVLGVDPAAQGRGLGPALTLAGLAHLRDRGLPAVMLYVEAGNAAAVGVYQRLGFTRWSADVRYARRPR